LIALELKEFAITHNAEVNGMKERSERMSSDEGALFHRLVIQVAEALATYELDEPHDSENPVGDEIITWDDITKIGQLPHEHRTAVTCRKCLADDWLYKAKYIAERLNV